MSQEPPPYSCSTLELTIKQANGNSCSAQITEKSGSVNARKNVVSANTGIRHLKGGDKFVKESGDINAGEDIKSGSTGIYLKKSATETAKVGTTGKLEADNIENSNTGIVDC